MQDYPRTYQEERLLSRPVREMFSSTKAFVFALIKILLVFGVSFLIIVNQNNFTYQSIFSGFLDALPYMGIALIPVAIAYAWYPRAELKVDKSGFVLTKGFKKSAALWSEVDGLYYSKEYTRGRWAFSRNSYQVFIRTTKKDSALIDSTRMWDKESRVSLSSQDFIQKLEYLSGKKIILGDYHIRSQKVALSIIIFLALLLLVMLMYFSFFWR